MGDGNASQTINESSDDNGLANASAVAACSVSIIYNYQVLGPWVFVARRSA